MGKIKELYMDMLHANDDNIPEEATIADLQRMKDLEAFEWQKYDKEQEKIKAVNYQSENPSEAIKLKRIEKKFSARYGKTHEKKVSNEESN
tara:strand:- start:4724 stop:4996 length:273 start_codon:yes stop_codon:yes gene_type:complete